ncbi:snRNA-activating protein complex subunit [Rhynchospora pubera]|uniref:snRNA-activating protein complex subunit n=1 Tax=Rhynchospora pubera TaxID=906938 RepID=A0AAV8H500_9POAL|nr:snRNA-activating protein complex subunit [Rhynchospora pubera]
MHKPSLSSENKITQRSISLRLRFASRLDLPTAEPLKPSAMEEDREEGGGENRFVAPNSRLPCARGGPIFLLDLVGPLSSGADFKASVLRELDCLQSDLIYSDLDLDVDLEVDELKILTEQELFERALQQNLEEDDIRPAAADTLQATEQADVPTRCEQPVVERESSCERSSSRSDEGTSDHSVVTHEDNLHEENVRHKKRKKKGRHFDRETRATQLEGPYLEKVKQLSELKRKQDEEKLAARLHSFCGTSTCTNSERMRSLKFSTTPAKVKATRPGQSIPIKCPEVILCVEIYHPKKYGTKTQEFLVLGSQMLTDLRDNIYCLTDKVMKAVGKSDPSAYFLIEDTFYNDLRQHSSIDYNRSIIDWLENSQGEASAKWDAILSGALRKKQKELLGDLEASSLPKFKTAHMQKTCFSNVRFRLGNGHLYCHQGNCRHLIVIRDMRLLDPDDAQMQGDYPMLIYQLRTKYRKCSVCRIYHANKMTVDDKWASVNPCYFCLNCYYLLHYNEDNTLLYPHQAFDYIHE